MTSGVLDSLASAMSISTESAQTVIEQAQRSHNILLRFNARLAGSMAAKYARGELSQPTLMSEAMQGLSDAIDRFDLSQGCAFVSFAFYYVLRDIQKCIVEQSRLIGLPHNAHVLLGKLMRSKESLIARAPRSQRESVREKFNSNSEALHSALASEMDVSEDVVARLLKAGKPTHDLDAPVYEGDAWLEYYTAQSLGSDDEESETVDSDLEAEVKTQVALSSLDSVLATLDARERNILRLRYGLNAERRVMKLTEIASAYNLSAERVRQISDAAIRKLSKSWRLGFLQCESEELF
eukprot:jgi/Ulvmu1/11379/UM075_0041.1